MQNNKHSNSIASLIPKTASVASHKLTSVLKTLQLQLKLQSKKKKKNITPGGRTKLGTQSEDSCSYRKMSFGIINYLFG